MKKILIIGGCGYIGSALYKKFSKTHRVDTVDLEYFGNFSNPNNIKSDFGDLDINFLNQYDTVILTAANSSVPLCANIYEAFDNNVNKFIKLVKNLKKQKFIYASSSCVYVTSDNKPKVETDMLYPMDGLTLTKTTIDQFMPLTDVEYYGLRFGSVNGYSPNMRLDLMINAMTTNALKNKCVEVFNGQAHRPILSIVDLVRAVETIVNSEVDKRGVYNLASVNHSIYDIGQKVANHLNVPVIDKGKNYTYDFTISSEKFIKEYNFEFTSTVESIADEVANCEFNNKWRRRDRYDR